MLIKNLKYPVVRNIGKSMAAVIIFSGFYCNAETYELGYEGMQTVLSSMTVSPKQTHISESFTENNHDWNLDVEFAAGTNNITISQRWYDQYNMFNFSMNESGKGNLQIKEYSLSSSGFDNQFISSITIHGCLYNSGALSTDEMSYIINIGETVKTHTIQLPNLVGAMQKLEDVTFTYETPVSGDITISFTSDNANAFAFRNIIIEYSEMPAVEKPVVSRCQTIPVGHTLLLETDQDDALIYYRLGNDDWQEYNQDKGIILATPGITTLQYYAVSSDGLATSETITEDLDIVQPSGLHAANVANQPIDVRGVVAGHGNGYILLGESSESLPSECLAIETVNFPELQKTVMGDSIAVTGRPTDRFGSELNAIGSLTAAKINNVDKIPTGINAIKHLKTSTSHHYDLQGRKIVSPIGRRRILINSAGEKTVVSHKN